MPCDPATLTEAAKCILTCIPPGQQLPALIALFCQIVDNGGGGGGGGTVTSFSSGNFSPLFTTSVATPTTTPALSFAAISQAQNLVYASPDGVAGNPSFRSLVAADLGTTMTPQFLRVGIGTPADAVMALTCLIPGAAGDQEVARFNATIGNPLIRIGGGASGVFLQYSVVADSLKMGPVTNWPIKQVEIDNVGSLTATTNVSALLGVFICQGNSGTSATYDATNTITTTGGIVTSSTQPTQIANRVFAGPAAAGPSVPTFRALVAADIPSLSAVYVPVGRTITIAVGSASLTTSAGAQDLSANRTWTLDTAQNIQTTATPQFARIGLGAAASASCPVLSLLNTTDFTNTVGANSHILLSNPNAAGQTNISFLTNGAMVGKFRVESAGNITYAAFGTVHSFMTGGDSGVGTQRVLIGTNIDCITGIYVCQGNSGVSGSFDSTNVVTVVGGIVTNIA